MIEFLATAFFATQPVQPAAAVSHTASRAPSAVTAPKGGETEITSKRMTILRDQSTLMFKEDVRAKRESMDLRCDELTAHYAQFKGKYTATRGECVGNVRAVDGERTATGERADFDVPSGVLVVTGNPEARDPMAHLRGSLVRMTLNTQNFEVENALVTLQGAPLKQPRRGGRDSPASRIPTEISSKRVVGTRNQAVFTGDVVVRHRTMDMRCDKMIAYYNAAREVTRAECVGKVRASEGERTARGERADFDVPSGVLVMTGNPEARDRSTHLRGTRVRMTLGNENFEVENAVITVEPAKEPSRP